MPERSIFNPALTSVKSPNPGSETDLDELAALFAERSRGSVSAEVAADLALDIVLNEIVEKACDVTGATGAAIILRRDGEMVCRASSGENTPDMGARLGGDSGLTAECVRTRKVQRCDDAFNDPRADSEASRSLGVRSVLVFPLLRGGELIGLLEAFSSTAAAFGTREELMLEALEQRVLKNLARAQEIFSANGVGDRAQDAGLKKPEESEVAEEHTVEANMRRSDENQIPAESLAEQPSRGFNVISFALAAAIVICAVLLATLIGMRMMARRSAEGRQQVVPEASAKVGGPTTRAQMESATSGEVPAGADSTGTTEKTSSSAVPAFNPSSDSALPEGSLRVYENGREVFRLPATGRVEKPARAGEVQSASAVESITPEAAASVLHRVEPVYPEQARQQRLQGAVVLDVSIGRDGAVQDVNVVSGQQVLADSAIAAVKQWKFKPRVEQGQALEMQTRVTLNFRLPG